MNHLDLLSARLSTVIRGEVSDPSFLKNQDWVALVSFAESHGMIPLLVEALETGKAGEELPPEVLSQLREQRFVLAAEELLREAEIRKLCSRLGEEAIPFLLMKGTPLAYTIYREPYHRMRVDTDLLVEKSRTREVTQLLNDLGYLHEPTSGFDAQRIFVKKDAQGFEQIIDLHWEVSSWKPFSRLFPWEELVRESIPVPRLGLHCRTLSLPHALLLACLHPAMHHYSEQNLIWLYDIHLIGSRFSEDDWDRFMNRVREKGALSLCLKELRLAELHFGTQVSWAATSDRSDAFSWLLKEPVGGSRARWRKMILWDLKSRQLFDGVIQLGKVVFPSPQYLFAKYRLRGRWKWLLFPGLIFLRAFQGGLKHFRRA